MPTSFISTIQRARFPPPNTSSWSYFLHSVLLRRQAIFYLTVPLAVILPASSFLLFINNVLPTSAIFYLTVLLAVILPASSVLLFINK